MCLCSTTRGSDPRLIACFELKVSCKGSKLPGTLPISPDQILTPGRVSHTRQSLPVSDEGSSPGRPVEDPCYCNCY